MDIIPGSLETPKWCERTLSEFGQNSQGENLLRVVWAPSRRILLGGYHEIDGSFAYRWAPKYGTKQVWLLEKWMAPRHYGSPMLWKIQTTNEEGYLTIGPYPSQGVFECTYIFGTPNFGFVPLMPELVLDTARAIHRGRWNKVWDIRANQMSHEKAKDVLADKHFEEMWESAQGVSQKREMSFGAGGVVNKKAKTEEYARRIMEQNAWERYEDFNTGFKQEKK